MKPPFLSQLKFDSNGLIPAIVQDDETGEVLTLAYMNEEAIVKTLETGRTWFYRRSLGRLMMKGATSGNIQIVTEVLTDCDRDCLVIKVRPQGPACHEGFRSCFYQRVSEKGELEIFLEPVAGKTTQQTQQG
ncbi:MAG: phosphoribosyl-AMP cyclohydrolase [Armatimonadetes bacterium]|nr:phosphoribosyl-AMP cyclohydrolase [Armatimonadota bacterium]MDW8122266.1 phosphoribosyl-AMP cyclohydrolase [Armatimonadota bacterium]